MKRGGERKFYCLFSNKVSGVDVIFLHSLIHETENDKYVMCETRPFRRSQKETFSLSLSLHGSSALVNLGDVCSCSCCHPSFIPPTSNQAPAQLLTLNIVQQGILTSDPVDVKMSSYRLFVFLGGRRQVSRSRGSRSVIRSDGLSGWNWRPATFWDDGRGSAASAGRETEAKCSSVWRTWTSFTAPSWSPETDVLLQTS